jgi:hypothetical protein
VRMVGLLAVISVVEVVEVVEVAVRMATVWWLVGVQVAVMGMAASAPLPQGRLAGHSRWRLSPARLRARLPLAAMLALLCLWSRAT